MKAIGSIAVLSWVISVGVIHSRRERTNAFESLVNGQVDSEGKVQRMNVAVRKTSRIATNRFSVSSDSHLSSIDLSNSTNGSSVSLDNHLSSISKLAPASMKEQNSVAAAALKIDAERKAKSERKTAHSSATSSWLAVASRSTIDQRWFILGGVGGVVVLLGIIFAVSKFTGNSMTDELPNEPTESETREGSHHFVPHKYAPMK